MQVKNTHLRTHQCNIQAKDSRRQLPNKCKGVQYWFLKP